MPDSRVGLLLTNLPELQPLKQQLARLASLQSALAAILLPNLTADTNVASVKDGELVLFASNGAVGSKLRQIAPRILFALCQRGYELTGIRIQVQVRTHHNLLPDKQNLLSADARVAVQKLAHRLRPSPLRDALLRLGGRGDRSNTSANPLENQ